MGAAKLPRLEYLFHFVEGQSLMPNWTRDVGISIQTEATAVTFHREQESRGQLAQMRLALRLLLLHRFHPAARPLFAICADGISRRRCWIAARLRAGNCGRGGKRKGFTKS